MPQDFIAANFINDTSANRISKAAKALVNAIYTNGKVDSITQIKNSNELEEIIGTVINMHGQTVMHVIAANASQTTALKIMKALKTDQHKGGVLLMTDDHGYSPLLRAKKKGLEPMVNALLNSINDKEYKEALIEAAINTPPVALKFGKKPPKVKPHKTAKKSKPKTKLNSINVAPTAVVTPVEKTAEPTQEPMRTESIEAAPVLIPPSVAQSDIQSNPSASSSTSSSSSSSSIQLSAPLTVPLSPDPAINLTYPLLQAIVQQVAELRALQGPLGASLPSPRSTILSFFDNKSTNHNSIGTMTTVNVRENAVDKTATNDVASLPAKGTTKIIIPELDTNDSAGIFSQLSPLPLSSLESPKNNSTLPRSSPTPLNYSFNRASPRTSSQFDWDNGRPSILNDAEFSDLSALNNKDADGFVIPQLPKMRN